MYWHIDDCIICLIFMCALCAFIFKDYVKRSRRDRIFLLCVVNCIIVLVVDIISSVALEIRINRYILHVAMTSYYALVLSVLVTWAYYLIELVHGSEPVKRRNAYLIMTAPYKIYLLLVALNLRTGWIYSISADGVYSRGHNYLLYYGYYFAYAAMLLIFIILNCKRIRDKYQLLILFLMPILLVIGVYVQIAVPGWMMVLPACAISLFISYLFIQHEHTEKLLDIKDDELQRVSEIAATDSMTGLLNHSETFARIEDVLNHEGVAGKHILVIIDMDDFKKVNDILGHQAGDEIVRQISARLKNFFDENDIVGRIGGDEFMALKRNVNICFDCDKLARELLEVLQFDCTDSETAVGMTVSIGIGFARVGKSFKRLYAETDRALYKAKAAGKNCYIMADDDSDIKPSRETPLAIHLRTILENMNGGIVLAEVCAHKQINITYISRSYYKYLAHDDLSEKSPECIMEYIYPPHREAIFNIFENTASSGIVAEYAYRYGCQGENWHLMHVARLNLDETQGGVPLIIVITDITTLKNSGMMFDTIAMDNELK